MTLRKVDDISCTYFFSDLFLFLLSQLFIIIIILKLRSWIKMKAERLYIVKILVSFIMSDCLIG